MADCQLGKEPSMLELGNLCVAFTIPYTQTHCYVGYIIIIIIIIQIF